MPLNYTLQDVARFWSKVDKSGDCWLWTAGVIKHGYGKFSIGRQSIGAHRFAYEITFGPPTPGMCVLHRCDVRQCVRPEHLWLGTKLDNTTDMITKGRAHFHSDNYYLSMQCRDNRGERNGFARLTANQVVTIRKRHSEGVSQRVLAEEYQVAVETIKSVVLRRNWRHVP